MPSNHNQRPGQTPPPASGLPPTGQPVRSIEKVQHTNPNQPAVQSGQPPQASGQQRPSPPPNQGQQAPVYSQLPRVKRSSQGPDQPTLRSSFEVQIIEPFVQTVQSVLQRIPGRPQSQSGVQGPNQGPPPHPSGIQGSNQRPPQRQSGVQAPNQGPPPHPPGIQGSNQRPPQYSSGVQVPNQGPPPHPSGIQGSNQRPPQQQSGGAQGEGLIPIRGGASGPLMPPLPAMKQPPLAPSQSSSADPPARQSQHTSSHTRAIKMQGMPSGIDQAEPLQRNQPDPIHTQEQGEHKADPEVQPYSDVKLAPENSTSSWRPLMIVVISIVIDIVLVAVFLPGIESLVYIGVLDARIGMVTFAIIFVIVGWLWGQCWHALQKPRQTPKEIELDQKVKHLEKILKDQDKQLEDQDEQLRYMEERLLAMTKRPPEQSVTPVNNPNQEQNHPRKQENDSKKSSQPLPRLSVYDKEEDPPGYDEATTQHPHHKLYPTKAEDISSLGYGWHIIGASRRGYGHAYTGKYREDDFAIRIFSDPKTSTHHAALVAIADGVSSKKYSRYGALAAVQGATRFFPPSESASSEQYTPKAYIENLLYMLNENAPLKEVEKQAYDITPYILREALLSAQLSVIERAEQHQPKLSADDLHSTLMVFLALPLGEKRIFVASTQIGDGVLFLLRDNGGQELRERWDWLQHAQIQGSGNEVQPFMRSNPDQWKHFRKCEVLEDTILVMGMTDGTADDIEPPRATSENSDPDPFTYVDDFYQHIKKQALREPQPLQASQALDDFLGYKKTQSHDDRTVICLYNEKLP